MTISHPHDPDQPDDIPARLSKVEALLCKMQGEFDAFSDDRKNIVTELASLVIDVSRLMEVVFKRRPSPPPTTAASAAERT